MSLNIKEAARFLKVSENKVRACIASGRLSVERKGRQILIPEAQLKALIDAGDDLENTESPEDSNPEAHSALSPEAAVQLISDRLTVLEGQINDQQQWFAENQRLHERLRERDRQLAEKDLQIEKLRGELVYQKRLGEKEQEDYRLALQEKWALMEKEAAARMAQEREAAEQSLVREREIWSEKQEYHRLALQEKWALMEKEAAARMAQEREAGEQRLVQERGIWSEKLTQEQERFAQTLAAMRRQEGFWSRLMKMITWS